MSCFLFHIKLFIISFPKSKFAPRWRKVIGDFRLTIAFCRILTTVVKRIYLLFRFIKYYFRAQTKYNIHSPFVFDFAEKVLDDDRWFYAFREVEQLRDLLLTERSMIEITDYGAGSQVSQSNSRSVQSLVKYSATGAVFCQILFRLVLFIKPKNLLELGTSMGISTLYQSSAALNSTLYTIEGCPQISKKALENFKLMNAENIELHTGKFEDVLPQVLDKIETLDYVFIDGNHRKEPTLNYFETCLEKAHDNSVFVFDDIHWTVGMEEAWNKVKDHPNVTLSIDLFFFGIVFFKKEFKVKQHFTLIKSWWKPWQIGLKDFFGW